MYIAVSGCFGRDRQPLKSLHARKARNRDNSDHFQICHDPFPKKTIQQEYGITTSADIACVETPCAFVEETRITTRSSPSLSLSLAVRLSWCNKNSNCLRVSISRYGIRGSGSTASERGPHGQAVPCERNLVLLAFRCELLPDSDNAVGRKPVSVPMS